MASIARQSPLSRPSCSLAYLRKSQVRDFSTSRLCLAQTFSMPNVMNRMPKQESISTRMKKLKRGDLPDDVGILTNTFVRPCGKMPSWFSEPSTRLRLEWLYARQSFADFVQRIYYNRWAPHKDPLTGRRQKMPLGYRERFELARDLHAKLYHALAAGDKTVIRKLACAGLANEQLGRLDNARLSDAPSETWSIKYRGLTLSSKLPFTLQTLVPSFLRSVHVLADREAQLPLGPGLTVRQLIARIDSTQTLQRDDGSKPITKSMREYVVLQRMSEEGKLGEWKVWGTTNPTTIEEGLDILNAAKTSGESMMERFRSQMPGTFN